MDDIILKETVINNNTVKFNFDVRGKLKPYFTTDSMFIEYKTNIENVPVSVLNIAFVSSILPLMWLTDTTMWVPDLDRTFYDSIPRLKYAYQDLYPNYPLKGNLFVAKVPYNTYKIKREGLLLFSGGIDAHVSYLRIKELHPILCNIQGWCKTEDSLSQAAIQDWKDIKVFAKKENLDHEFVKSNFATLIASSYFHKMIEKRLGDAWWHGFQHSMGFISISIPLAYLYGIRNIYIASSFALGLPGKCASYANTDIEFKFATYGGCIHDAFELSRQDKVHTLVNYQKNSGKPYPVRVCSFNDHNCCECEKCFRTILEIVAENGDVKDFGFEINGTLKNHWQNVMDKKIHLFGVQGESTKHWPSTIERMKDNYQNIDDKEFVDWFLSYNFLGNRKKALREYYSKNFFSILKRKINNRIGKD